MNNPFFDDDDNVKITQIDPPEGFTELEKSAIKQYKKEKEEELSKTQEFKLINRNKKINSKINKQRKVADGLDLPVLKNTNTKFEDEFELPKLKKRKPTLHETIVIKIDGISREAVKKNKTDLYHTAIIKLNDIIKNRSSLKKKDNRKVNSVEEIKRYNKHFSLFGPRDITRLKNIKINVDSPEFGRQLYNLNKLALNNLTLLRPKKLKARKYSTINKLASIDKIKIKKADYLKYQDKLNRFAINKLYYKLAPKESKKYKIYRAGVVLSSLAFFISLGFIINWGIQGVITNKISKELAGKVEIVEIIDGGEIVTVEDPAEGEKTEMKEDLYWKYLSTPLSSVNLSKLIQENNDTIGWLIVKNTNVNYPVVQTSNNDYYLTHSFTRQYNSAGWIYADFRDNFDNFNNNMVIYGHGRYDKVMFGSLTNTLKKDWYTDPNNQIIQLSTIKYNTMWQIFSIYKIPSESYYITTDFGSDTSYGNFLNEMKKRSIYDFGVNLTTKDKILTLSTCYNDNGIRLVVQAKLVKIQER